MKVSDNDQVEVRLSATEVEVTEGDPNGASYTLVLDNQPNAEITITPAAPPGSAITVHTEEVVFTSNDWNEPKTVRISAGEDANRTNEQTEITHTASGTYSDLVIASMIVNIRDDDPLATVNPSALTFREGEEGELSYALGLVEWTYGTRTLTVDIDAGEKLTTIPERVQFTQSNWTQAITVRVTRNDLHDPDAVDDRIEIRHTPSAFANAIGESVTVTIEDDDEAGVTINGNYLPLDEGDTGRYQVELTAAPVEPFTLTIGGMEGTSVEVRPASIEFKPENWARRRTVHVEATEDADANNESIILEHTVPSEYFAGAIDTVSVEVDDDEEPVVLTGPPTTDTVLWGTLRVGDSGGTSFGYQPALDVGYLSDPTFEYAGEERTIDAIYLSDGAVHLWMSMGDADALPSTMVLHVGNDTLALAHARHIDHGEVEDEGRFHWYRWADVNHMIEWEGGEVMGIWLQGPADTQLADAPTALTATPEQGGVALAWKAPGQLRGTIVGYEYQRRVVDAGPTGHYWWPTESTATSYTVKPLRAGEQAVFRVRAVTTHGNGAESAATDAVAAQAVNRPPRNDVRMSGKGTRDTWLKTNTRNLNDPNGMENARFEYQWVRTDGYGHEEVVPGADEQRYRVQEEDEGKYMKVVVEYTDDDGFDETVESEERLLGERTLLARLNPPEEHDGATTFTLRLYLTKRLGDGAQLPTAGSFEVTNGTVEDIVEDTEARMSGKVWYVSVRPWSAADVVVAIPPVASCAEPGAICTAEGERIANPKGVTIPGPLTVSVADARAEEGVDRALAFPVTLSRAVDRTVTVGYETEDASAHAGSDYEAASGTLDFRPGETERTIIVAVLDDKVDEGEEQFVLVLMNPTGAKVGDGTATGTIANSDPLQQRWLAQFGRTVAHQVVDGIGQRLDGPARTHVTVAGRELGGAPAKDAAHGLEANSAHGKRVETLSAEEALSRSAFMVSSGTSDATGTAWAAWGRMARSGFAWDDDEMHLTGHVTSALVGVDAERGDWLAGAALAHNRAGGSYRRSGDAGREVGTTLTSIHPYARRRVGDNLSVWGIAGYGTGTLTLDGTCRDGADAETDVDMSMAATGVRGTLLEPAAPGALRLGVRSDFTWSRTRSDFATSANCGNLEAGDARTRRARLVVDGATTWGLDSGGTFTPSVEIGLRHDGGTPRRGSASRRAPACTTAAPGSPSKPACGGFSCTRTVGTRNGARARR